MAGAYPAQPLELAGHNCKSCPVACSPSSFTAGKWEEKMCVALQLYGDSKLSEVW